MPESDRQEATQEAWTPVSASYDPGGLGLNPDSYIVVFARNQEDGWEFARDEVPLREMDSIDSREVMIDE